MLKVPGNVHLALQKALLFRSCLFRGKNFDYFCSENLQVWDYPVIWKVPSALDSNDAISFEDSCYILTQEKNDFFYSERLDPACQRLLGKYFKFWKN